MLQPGSRASTAGSPVASLVESTADRLRKRGIMMATWYDSESHAQVSGTDCTLVLRGNTARMKTHLFSRIVRGLILPNYDVAAFFYEVADPARFSSYSLSQTEAAVAAYMHHFDIRWCFLYFIADNRFSNDAVNWARRYRRKEIGVVLVGAKNHQLEFAPDMLLPRHASKYVRFA